MHPRATNQSDMAHSLPKLDPSIYVAALAYHEDRSLQSKEQYLGVIMSKSIEIDGIELPIPYQITFEDHFQSRLEPHALEEIISKTSSFDTQPTVMIEPMHMASPIQVQLKFMALAKALQA